MGALRLTNNSVRRTTIYLVLAFLAIQINIFLLWTIFEFPSLIINILVVLSILVLFFDSKFALYLFMLSLFLTEFYWIEVFEGYLKPFHIMSVLVFVFFSIRHIKVLLSSKITILLIAFVVTNLVGILIYAVDKLDAVRSFILPLILIIVAINGSMMLHERIISFRNFSKVIMLCALITVIFGFVQMIGHRFFGQTFSLAEGQIAQIAIANRPPSFFTEADTYGKFLSFPFFFLLPFAIESHVRFAKHVRLVLLLILVGIFVNMTRSAMIGIGVTLVIYTLYSLRRRSASRNVAIVFGTLAVILITFPIILGVTKVFGSDVELSYRLKTLVSPVDMAADGSARFRLAVLGEMIKGILGNLKAFLIGYGWGQSYIHVWGVPREVGGNLFVNILYYSGVLGFLIFTAMCYRVLKAFHLAVKYCKTGITTMFSEGLLFSFICMLVISQLASMWITPEFWLVIGCAIYFELSSKVNENYSYSQ